MHRHVRDDPPPTRRIPPPDPAFEKQRTPREATGNAGPSWSSSRAGCSFGRDPAAEPVRPEAAEEVAEDPAARLSGRCGRRRRRRRRACRRAASACRIGAPTAASDARCPSQTDRARAPGRRRRVSSPSAPPRAERDAEPGGPVRPAPRVPGAVVGRRRGAATAIGSGTAASPPLDYSVPERIVRPRRRRPGRHCRRAADSRWACRPPGRRRRTDRAPGGRFGIPGVRRAGGAPRSSGPGSAASSSGMFPGGSSSERLLAVRSLGARASPAGRERPPARGVIAEILLLVDLVCRIFLIARHPLPPDRRQREQPGLLSLHAPDRLTAAVSTTIVSAWATLLEFVRILASSARGDCLASEISWAEAVPLSPTNLSRSIGFPRSLTTANLGKGGIIRALRK